MSEPITLEVPEALVHSARTVGARTHRRVEDVLAEWLGWTAGALPIESLSDEQVLALRDLRLDDGQQEELSALLERQREGLLTGAERARLVALLDLYQQGMLQKARALKVAVERGLQPPLGAT
jgi:hypothetical protein